MKPRLLYITHTAWSWIKQRPQFLAEGLAEYFDVDVMYRKSNHLSAGDQKNQEPRAKNQVVVMDIRGFRNLPLERIALLPLKPMYRVNRMLWRSTGVRVSDYDYVWVTDPLLWWNIAPELQEQRAKSKEQRAENSTPHRFAELPLSRGAVISIKDKEKQASRLRSDNKPVVIYDCMDDALEFPYARKYPKLLKFIAECEADLVSKADHVFCSSGYLASRLMKRYGTNRHIDVVNNAISDSMCAKSQDDAGEPPALRHPCLTYIGTISDWFDFPLVLKALERYPTLRVRLYGPLRTGNTPQHERLEYMGAVTHDKVMGIMQSATALMMPFVVNELILSVNPVKLYEYILAGKPVVATRYGETEQFGEFVTLYSTEDEFFEFIEERVLRPYVCDAAAKRQFAMRNTWSARCRQIAAILRNAE